jgi:hypothetical protein
MSSQTVFTSKEIALLTGENRMENLKSKLAYSVRTKKLIRLRRGIFAKDDKYNPTELATRIYTPAYVSLETVLAKEGVIFQYYDTLFVMSYLTREITIGSQKISYCKIKDEILTNPVGLINRGTYFEATKERAFLDRLYLFDEYYFDNLRSIDWDLCQEIVTIYKSKKLVKALNQTFFTYQQQYAQ